MSHFTKQEIEEIRQRLATLAVKDSQFPTANVVDFEDFVAIVQNGVNKKVSIRDLYRDVGESIYDNYYFSLPLYVKNGSNILRNGGEADIVAVVQVGNTDITQRIAPSFFSWERSSGDTYNDTVWNRRHDGVGPEIHVTRSDINRECTFYCLVPVEAIKDIII